MSVVLLADQAPDARGVGVPRVYVEFMDGWGEGFDEDDAPGDPPAAPAAFRGATLVQMGWLSVEARLGDRNMVDRARRHSGFELRGQMEQAYVFQGDPRTDAPAVISGGGLGDREQHAFLRNPVTALEEPWATNVPSRFVVEPTPSRVRDPARSRRVPRSHERPVYTLLEPAAIRRQYVPAGGRTGRRVSPHERRRHYRTLRSDRFTHMQGRTAAVVGNRRYGVREL